MGAAGLLHDPGVACRPRGGDRPARADYAMAGAAWALPGASANRDLDVANLDLRVDNGGDRLPDVLSALCASGGCSASSETSLEIDTQFQTPSRQRAEFTSVFVLRRAPGIATCAFTRSPYSSGPSCCSRSSR